MGDYADQENLNCLAEMVPKLTKERDDLKDKLSIATRALQLCAEWGMQGKY